MMTGNAGKPRILAFIIDNLLASIAAIAMVALFKVNQPLINGAILSLTYLGYYLAFEALWSRTPGKLVQGLEVCKLDGSRCDFKAALIRTILRIFEVNPLLLGGLPAGIAIIASERKQRLGDRLAGTIVKSKER
ncbi:MAG: hypothetical protein V7641_3094 [Blastocatellia bacterium]